MEANDIYSLKIIKREMKQLPAAEGVIKYLQLYSAIKSNIDKELLPYKWHLPSTRDLSTALHLSRSTVIRSYEMLMLEKYITSKKGSGYWVSLQLESKTKKLEMTERDVENSYPTLSKRGHAFLKNRPLLNRIFGSSLSFQPGIPPIDIFPMNLWKNLWNNYWSYIKSSELSYGQASGSDLLKIQISNYLRVSRNIKCLPSQIIIVSGSLQSLYLLANALVDDGDQVIIEDPTFPNVHAVFKSCLADLKTLSLDKNGMDISQFPESPKKPVKLIHVTPTGHYPTGNTMGIKRKKELLAFAAKHKAYIIENDYEREVSDTNNSRPPIFSIDDEHRTIYLGTFNRLLFPSVRLGYMIVPQHLVSVIESLQELSHRFVSPLTQLVMEQFIEKNHLYRHFKNLNETAKRRKIAFVHSFKEEIPDMILIKSEIDSLHIVAQFKKQVGIETELRICQKLLKTGISVFPLSKCYINLTPQTGFIIGYATINSNLIMQKLKIFARVLKESNL
jgi:GntR family transcriptional regulator / MocR family aminotransferase